MFQWIVDYLRKKKEERDARERAARERRDFLLYGKDPTGKFSHEFIDITPRPQKKQEDFYIPKIPDHK